MPLECPLFLSSFLCRIQLQELSSSVENAALKMTLGKYSSLSMDLRGKKLSISLFKNIFISSPDILLILGASSPGWRKLWVGS